MEYELKRSQRAKALRIAVHPDTSVVVTAPSSFSTRAIERFVAERWGWAERHIERAKRRFVIRIRRGDVPALKKRALELCYGRARHFAKQYDVSFRRITIRAQKSRWGSCSRRGNLSFNYRIAVLPARIADYIIVHELCHLREMNHSKRFWVLVAQACLHHAAVRKELRLLAFMYD